MKVWRAISIASIGSFAILATLLPAMPRASASPPTGFIQRQGQQLLLNGQPFHFTGLNIYNANSNGSCAADMQSGSALDEALANLGSGATVIRAWFFQSFATTNGQRDWTAFDHTLSVAAAHGIRVIPVLANQWPDCEPASGYKDETWYQAGYTQPDPSGTVSYRDFVAEVVARYANDPVVAFWQLMNEPQVTTDSTSGICSANAESLLESFASDVSGLVKSIDPNHLVSLGSIGSGQCGLANDDYRQIHAIATIDLCEFHDYNDLTPIPGDQWNGLQVRFNQCAQLNKPLFVGEMGYTPAQAGGGLAQRAQLYATKLRAQFDAGSVGELLWAWYEAAPPSLDSLDIHRSDPALRVLAAALTPNFTSIGAGWGHTCVTTTAGTVKCWGGNFGSSLGDGTAIQRNRPVDVLGISSGASAVDGGENHTCALVGSGVKCWGLNNSGEIGTGSSGGLFPSPTSVTGVSNATALTTGTAHACALLTGGTAMCWGSSGSGQLGGGFPIGSGVYGPQAVATAAPLQQVAAGGSHTCAVTVAGGAKCWGSNQAGQVGDGDQFQTSPRANPVDVVGLTSGVIQVAAGNAHSCALTVNDVECWGIDSSGQLGNGQIVDFPPFYTPVPVVGLPDGIQAIAAGGRHTCAITAHGGVLCWGDNTYGQLGNNSTNNSGTPVQVSGMTSGAIALALGDRHTCALMADGTVWCWGNGQYGQLGNRSTSDSHVPVQVNFTVPAIYALSVTMSGQGTGRVHTDAFELYCQTGTCSVDFDDGTQLNLTAEPDQGSLFAGWSGGGCSGTGVCHVTMDQARSVTAMFNPAFGSPGKVSGLTATFGNGTVTISWSAAASNGSPITGYAVTGATPGSPNVTQTVSGTTLSATFAALSHCVPYAFTVQASNAGGPGPVSDQLTGVVPSAMTNVTVSDTVPPYAYSPQAVVVPADQCTRLKWTFSSANTKSHTVTEASSSKSGLGPNGNPLFDSGSIGAGGSYGPSPLLSGATFYQYHSATPADTNTSPSLYGSVTMPVVVVPGPAGGRSPFTVRWAPAPMAGYAFTIQYQFKKSGAKSWPTSWTSWLSKQMGNQATFTPSNKDAGTYRFWAKITNTSTNKSGGWSWVSSFGLVCPCQLDVPAP